MKTVVNYLKKNKKYIHNVMGRYFELELKGDNVILRVKDDEWEIDACPPHHEVEYEIQEILEEHKIEIRFCEVCGMPFDAGFTTEDGGWYCCENCFEGAMDKDYGKGKWRGTDEEGEYGGFYEYFCCDEWEDTGIYWTHWY